MLFRSEAINKYPNSNNPKNVNSKKFKEINSIRNEFIEAMRDSGNVVTAAGHLEIV